MSVMLLSTACSAEKTLFFAKEKKIKIMTQNLVVTSVTLN